MNLRCSPGDLAIIIAGHDRSLGQSVTCVRLIAPGELLSIGGLDPQALPPDSPACWLVDPPVQWLLLMTIHGETTERYVEAPYCADQCLMPIRPRGDDVVEDAADQPASLDMV